MEPSLCSLPKLHESITKNGKRFFVYHEFFLVSEEVSKVNVEQVARCGDHDVVIVSVSYPLCAWSHDHHMTFM